MNKIERLYTIKKLGSAKNYLGYNNSRDKEKVTLKIDQADPLIAHHCNGENFVTHVRVSDSSLGFW